MAQLFNVRLKYRAVRYNCPDFTCLKETWMKEKSKIINFYKYGGGGCDENIFPEY